MRDKEFHLLHILCFFLFFLKNGTGNGISIQPNPVYIPTANSTNISITCTVNAPNVGYILGMSLERNLTRDSTTRNLVTILDATPQLNSTAPEDLKNRSPAVEGFFQHSNTSSYFTLRFSATDLGCEDKGNYACVTTFIDTSFTQATIWTNEAIQIRHSPSKVALNLYKNGIEITNVSENTHESFLVGDKVHFVLRRHADISSTYTCLRTNASSTTDTLIPFSPHVVSSTTSKFGDCNFFLTTNFSVVMTEEDGRRENNYVVQCLVTSGTTVYSRKIYLAADIDECLSSTSCVENATCSNTHGSYICTCNDGFTGDGRNSCTVINYCESNPCQNGICYTSSEGFTCTCDSGFTGTMCDTDINECILSRPCANNATCTNTNGSYECSCNNGYTGNGTDHCIDIDECQATGSCANNSVCLNTPGSYICTCDTGFTGNGVESCTDVNECLASTSCAQNASCTNTPGSYICTCDAGFTGDGYNTCSDEDECLSSTSCAEDATCTNSPGSYMCMCNAGFTGDGRTVCSDIDECLSSSACAENAECTNTNGNYTCSCNNGYTGDGRDTCSEIDNCISSPCRNGVCNSSTEGFSCICWTGFTGLLCETDVDECLLSSSCVSNSTCTNTNGSYVCTCNEGLTGNGKDECSDIDECALSLSCANNSVCTNTVGSFKCMCDSGFTGNGQDSCTDIDECLSHTACADNAACTNTPGSYTCTCDFGLTGNGRDNCTDIDECQSSIACAVNATCTNTHSNYTCSCNNGFTGDGKDRCTEIDNCASNPCQNGVCHSSVDDYKCTCNSGYTGLVCDTDINECLSSNACINGTCTNTPGSFTCTCGSGYTGDGSNNCIDINECLSPTSCANNTDCTNTQGSYTCACKAGFTGDGLTHCSDINECLSSNSCANNAVCTNTAGSYTCTCRNGYTGDGKNACTDINECSSDPCQHSGFCYNYAGSFHCYCTSGWTGTLCESDVNECSRSSSCAANAACTNTLGSYSCRCNSGFTGDGRLKCTENVLVPIQSGSYYYRSDDNIYSFYIPGGMDYYGKLYYWAYVSMNGYITLGSRYSSRYPWTSSSSWRSFRYPIIAPLWSDIDTRGNYGETGLYVNRITSRTVLEYTIKPAIGDNNFMPRYCLMVTWKKAVPYPYISNERFERADFQVLIATNSSFTYIVFNYDQDMFTWRPSGGRLVAVGYSTSSFTGNIRFSSYSFVNVNKLTNVGKKGRWRYSVSYPGSPIERAKALCINWFYDSYISYYISYARARSAPCPCSYSQVIRDWRYRYTGYRNGIYHYRERWSRWPYSHRQRCHYKRYNTWSGWRWSTRGYLLYGYPGGGYMESYDSRLGITDAYNNCCVQRTGLCHLFYYRNPSRSCSGYRPPSWRPANGDPHITTLDGKRYTFNGRGEYSLVDITADNITLKIQVRTDLVNDNDTDATIFVGIAGKDGSTGDVVEVLLDRETNSSNIYINGNYSGQFSSETPDSVYLEADRVTIFNDSDKLVLAFESGVSVQVSVHNLLDIVTSAPDDGDFAGNTKGLLGNNDGDASNDFRLKNGTLLSVNSTEEQLFEFGMSWSISENESLFNYTISGNGFDFYNNPEIRPKSFISDILNNLTAYLETNCPGKDIDVNAIEKTCEDNVACKVDAAATCNTAFGKASKDTEKQVEEENEVLENFPPVFTAPDTLYIGFMENKTVTLDMNNYVNDSNLDVISIETTIPDDQFSFESNTFKWNVSEELRIENKTVYVRFTANDTMGASSEYWPDVYYCGCEKSLECDYSLVLEDNDNEDHFYSARCNCSEDREGLFCETVKDRCNPNPCYENVTCDNTQSGSPCGACPAGMSGDGLRCEDTNECYREPPPCNQTCENIVGSYTCSCTDGYILNNDNHNCDDVDECDNEADICAENEVCRNSPGTFSCTCAAGFAYSNDTCVNVTSSFVGVLVFVTLESNITITEESVENMLLTEVSKKDARIIAAEVLQMDKVETDRTKTALARFNSTFVLHSADSTLKTVDVIEAFAEIEEQAELDSNGATFAITIDKDKSNVYSDKDYGICNITDKVTCDLETTTCTSTDGVQTCNCKEGFEQWSTRNLSCKDTDECTQNSEICGEHGTCENTVGSYTCKCNLGFRLDEKGTCIDICTSNPCKNGGTCTHKFGEDIYSCQCTDGWTGFSCEDNTNDERNQLIAIAVGTSAGIVLVLLCISILLWRYRRYKVNSKGLKETTNIPQTRNTNASCSQKFQIPRPCLQTSSRNHCYINGAYNDSAQTFNMKSRETENGQRNVREDLLQGGRQLQDTDSQEYF